MVRFAGSSIMTLVLILVPPRALAQDDNWPQFRGPSGDGHVSAPRFPLQWAPDRNLAWKAPLAGTGWSQPIVWQGKVFVTAAVSDSTEKPKKLREGARDPRSTFTGPAKPPSDVYRWELTCLDLATGQVLWQQRAAEQAPGIPTHPSNTYATETPATDGEHVFVWFASIGKVFAYTLAGQLAWQVDLGVYPMTSNLGTGSSPIVVGGRLIVQNYNEENAFLVALDPKTGRELWRADRSKGTSWSTPYIWHTAARSELIACGNGKVDAYDPTSGAPLWEIGNFPSSFSATPVATRELLILGNNGPFSTAPLWAVKAGASGDISIPKDQLKPKETAHSDAVAWWRFRSGPGLSSSVVVADLLFVTENSILSCYDTQSGERYFRERLPEAKDIVASPLVLADKLLYLDENGRAFLIRAAESLEVLATSKLDDVFWASPAVAGESLLLRGVENLYCIRAAK
ncbi:MAG: PQQ-like beta-propeller repeat protein [Pirellulales bacterium]|nr:PQQ-like beta-propeller repeat protein [Pirellulales bacterium]